MFQFLKNTFCSRAVCRIVSGLFATALFACQPALAWAAEPEAEKPPEWVLSYALIMLFVGLSIVILLRNANRSASTFSQEELDKMKEEEMKKLTGSHT